MGITSASMENRKDGRCSHLPEPVDSQLTMCRIEAALYLGGRIALPLHAGQEAKNSSFSLP